MKVIHYINVTLYSICVILIIVGFIDKEYGFNVIISHIVLGIGQPFLNLIIVCNLNNIDKTKRIYSHYYWDCVVLFFLLVFIFSTFDLDYSPLLNILMALPFLIATYSIYSTYKIQKS